jgi:hypothetical protein
MCFQNPYWFVTLASACGDTAQASLEPRSPQAPLEHVKLLPPEMASAKMGVYHQSRPILSLQPTKRPLTAYISERPCRTRIPAPNFHRFDG